ncbi:uncharacterized protein LOC111384238 [Olea europaea var. sylvestris]|uniref:uncharacterized protein LOC111384238 n=1 Tax=Olea europaea var. sylvestris TaxID=158386 RepID=UPI000C1D68E2|nr:uncharacterized protein LOC111384238 [Olea europaea var. sylvestris]
MIDAAAGGILMAKTENDAYALLDDIATNNCQWPSERLSVKKVAGLHEVDPITALAAQVTSLTNQIVTLTTQGNQQKADLVMRLRNHENLSYGNNRNTLQPPPGFNTQNSEGKPSLEGKFPSDTEVNPREQCKAIVLRDGKQVGESESTKGSNPTPDKEEEQVVVEQEKQAKGTKTTHRPYSISFPDNLPILTQHFHFHNALEQMPNYAEFMKEVMSKKRKLEEYEIVKLTEECSVILQKKLPQKRKDPGSFTIPRTIGSSSFDKALCALGASINLMPLSVFRKLGLGEVKPRTVTLQLADRSLTYPRGIIEDVLVNVDKFIFPADFVVLDMEEDQKIPLILGRPFLAIGRALIDVQGGHLTLRVNEEEVRFNIYQAMKYSDDHDTCHRIDFIDSAVRDEKLCIEDLLVQCMMFSATKDDIITFGKYIGSKDLVDCILALESTSVVDNLLQCEDIQQSEESDDKESNENSKIKLKQLPDHLRYAFLGDNSAFPVIISSSLNRDEEDILL